MTKAFGKHIKVNIEGASRDPEIFGSIEGFPSGVKIDFDRLNDFMQRRAPGQSMLTTQRKETDIPIITSGFTDNKTNGNKIELYIRNEDAEKSDSVDYSVTPRPGHADLAAVLKYGKDLDVRGGGHFSGRLTAPLCAIGGICIQYLEGLGIKVFSHIERIGEHEDDRTSYINPDYQTIKERIEKHRFPVYSLMKGVLMESAVKKAKDEGDSIGGSIECFVTGLPAGIGEHMFDSVEANITDAIFAIPGVKAVGFGPGEFVAQMYGSQNNDGYRIENGKITFETNYAGGVLGGMTTGAPIVFHATFKPTPSISKSQHTVNLETNSNTDISVEGRNDPCIVLRASPVVEACAAIAITDLILGCNGLNTLCDCRMAIDEADREISTAFEKRMKTVARIAEIKQGTDSPIYVASREKDVLSNVISNVEHKAQISELYETLFRISRNEQRLSTLNKINGFKDKKCYLIGEHLGHSYSPLLHSLIADYSYELKEIPTEQLDDFFKKRDFDGLNVTIPYKKTVLKYLDALEPISDRIGSVNTIVNKDGMLLGFNSDYYGIKASIKALKIDDTTKKAVILGNGGAASTVRTVLEETGIEQIITVTRKNECGYSFADINDELMSGALLVNATPIGMAPALEPLPFDKKHIKKAKAVFDLVYNPCRTELIEAANDFNVPSINGLLMLCTQALFSAKCFTDTYDNDLDITSLYKEMKYRLDNVILIGMPGCGKTTIGLTISKITGKRFFDTDTDILERTGYSPRDFILHFGIEEFRREEKVSISTASHLKGAIISTGGGAVIDDENLKMLRSCGSVFFIERDLDALCTQDRPVTADVGVKELYKQRIDQYRKCADITVINESIDKTAEEIIGIMSK